MSSPQMTRMLGFAGRRLGKRRMSQGERTPQCEAIKSAPVSSFLRFHRTAAQLPVRLHSNAKMRFQSFFMLMTVQPFLFASS